MRRLREGVAAEEDNLRWGWFFEKWREGITLLEFLWFELIYVDDLVS